MIEEVVASRSGEDVVQILRNEPSQQQLEQCLRYIQPAGDLDISVPGAWQTQALTTLVTKTVLDFHDILESDQKLRRALVASLSSVPGLGALLARLRTLIREQRQTRSGNEPHSLNVLLELLSAILHTDDHAVTIISRLHTSSGISLTQRTLLWKEYISLTAGGKITNTVAEISKEELGDAAWLGDGPSFARWLGQQVAQLTLDVLEDRIVGTSSLDPVTQLCSKCLSFGYNSKFLGVLVTKLCSEKPVASGAFSQLVQKLRSHDQRKLLDDILSLSSTVYLPDKSPSIDEPKIQTNSRALGAVIALLGRFIHESEAAMQHLCDWLLDAQRSATASSGTLRAVVAVIADDEDKIEETLSKVWEQWANQLFINHASTAQQNAVSQSLLMAAGYVHRAAPMYLFTMARSSVHTHGLSNRLNSTSPRARWLGMVVSMAMSKLVDKSGNKLTFDNDEMTTAEAQWYGSLTSVKDQSGHVQDLQDTSEDQLVTIPLRAKSDQRQQKPRAIPQGKTKAQLIEPRKRLEPSGVSIPSSLRIIELDETEDLTPYAKPDSDPEDDSTDATMVNRNKPKPPIYIRDLIRFLLDSENIERRTLALQSAPSLIRRKTGHGKEVSDHVEELATVIAGLNDGDTFDVGDEEFARLRQKSLQAVLVSDAKKMGPWFAKATFNVTADYSVAQRMGLLIAIGLGGRELAGYRDDDDHQEANDFPSRKLKGKMHEIWAGEPQRATKKLKPIGRNGLLANSPAAAIASSSAVDRLTTDIERTMLEPLALDAADKLSGPDVLKIRKFSSRMDVEQKKVKPKANELSKIIAEAFFFPLTGYLNTGVQTRASGSSASFNKYLLSTYLRTLSLLLHSAGPSTLSLATMTTEFWDLLLTLRSAAMNDAPALEALLFSLLTLLELHAEKQDVLVQDHAKELIETQEWARIVLENAPSGGGNDGEDKVKMLAAGVVVRCSEVVQKYQRRLLGDMVDI